MDTNIDNYDSSKDEEINSIINQTQCSKEIARQVYSKLGNTIDSILYILEGEQKYNNNENLCKKQKYSNLNESEKIHYQKIDELRVIVDDKDAIYESKIHN